MEYRPRIVDKELELYLKSFGAVSIEGPKWCGKTTTALRHSASAIFMQDEDRADDYLRLAEDTPSLILRGPNPRLVDEWQVAPRLWDAVRFSVDQRGERGLYILAGSANVDKSRIKHSGMGRIAPLRMRTMSLWESGDSTGEVSLGRLFSEDGAISGESPHGLEDVARILVRGGWPGTIGDGEDVARANVRKYCELMLETEISTVDGRRRDPARMGRILRSLSRNTASQAADTKILADVDPQGGGMDVKTLRDYIGVLERINVVEDLHAWSPRLRSKAAVRCSDTRHLTDPAIAAHFLGASAGDLVYDMNTFGLLFESLVVRDLRVYAQSLEGEVYHYRDSSGLEVDAVVHLWNGRWGAIEVKLSPSRVDEAAGNLKKLAGKVDSEAMNPPSFLAVVVGRGSAYTRPDGVHVVPIGCLRERPSLPVLPLVLLPALGVHLAQVPPGDDGPLDGGEVADDGEPEHHDLHPAELDAEHLEGAPAELDHDPLDYGEDRGQHDPVRPAEQAGVEPRGPYRLGLGAHVGRQEHADEGQHAEVRVAPRGAERYAADHEHVGVPVEDVVEVVALGAGLAGELGHLAVEGVEVARDQHDGGAHQEQPLPALRAAEVEYEPAEERQDEPDPRQRVGVDVDKPPRDRVQREVDPRPLPV